MLKTEGAYMRTYRYTTLWSVELVKTSRAVKYWNLHITQLREGQVTEKVLLATKHPARLQDVTGTMKHSLTKQIVVKKKLRLVLAQAANI